MPDDLLRAALEHPAYPRSAGYDPAWIARHEMGPNALWLLEALLAAMPIERGARVLDLGCGRALTSIFLARELDVRVTAVDLWIPAEENRARIREAGVEDRVTAVHAEAHALPFEPGAFDAIVSIDAYQYFGTDDLYLGTPVHLLRDGGRLGVVVPATLRELDGPPPAHLAPFWEWEFACFHAPAWWRRHWAKTGLVDVEVADAVPDGARDWLRFGRALLPSCTGWRRESWEREIAMLEADRDGLLGFARVVARKRAEPAAPGG
ncbi:MAG: methyltransferase domain-containing protein [Myxococcales bacterium]|nr:methyltransferase domain-containing protein [Myxococcales bacterium]